MRAKAAVPIVCALALSACNQNVSGPAAPSSRAAAATVATPAAAPGPHRRPGLWELRVSMEGVDAVERTQICVHKASDQKIALWGAQSNSACSRNVVEHEPDGSWRFEANCDMGSGGWIMTKGVVSGDLSSRYVVQAETTRTGAEVPQMNRTMKVTVEAKRIGDCPAGWSAGDFETGGMRANALQIGGAR